MAGGLLRSILSKRKGRNEKSPQKRKRQKNIQKEEPNNIITEEAAHVDETFGCYHVNYKVGKRIDGRTFTVTMLHPKTNQPWKEATLRVYETTMEARTVYHLAETPTHPSIIRALYSDFPENGYAKILFDEFFEYKFEDWAKNLRDPWLKLKGRASDVFCKTFTNIASVLDSLHLSGQRNGVLKNSIRISNDNQVQLVEFKEQGPDFINGILEDIDDFRDLVKIVVGQWDALKFEGIKCFMLLKGDFIKKAEANGLPRLDYDLMRSYAFFMLNNPLFCDDAARFKLMCKILQFRALDVKKFECNVKFDMMFVKWKRVDMKGSLLKQFEERDWIYEDKEKEVSILSFFHDCFNHQQTIDVTPVNIQQDIDTVYPEVLDKLFYAFVKTFGTDNKYYGFGIVKYFREVEPSVSVRHR